MTKDFKVDLQIEFIPLSPEQVHAWRWAFRQCMGLLDENVNESIPSRSSEVVPEEGQGRPHQWLQHGRSRLRRRKMAAGSLE